jgi:SPP1 family predicted phage head-tail adaptor
MPDPGALRELVTLQEEVLVDQGGGGNQVEWNSLATFEAEILPLAEVERLSAMRLGSETSFRIMVRYRTDVTPNRRLVWNGDPLNVRSAVDPDGRRQWTKIVADLGVAT